LAKKSYRKQKLRSNVPNSTIKEIRKLSPEVARWHFRRFCEVDEQYLQDGKPKPGGANIDRIVSNLGHIIHN